MTAPDSHAPETPAGNENLHPLAARLRDWRKNKTEGGNAKSRKMSLHETKAIVGLSVGYISDLETGKVPVTMEVYRKYHAVDPRTFPLADAGLLL